MGDIGRFLDENKGNIYVLYSDSQEAKDLPLTFTASDSKRTTIPRNVYDMFTGKGHVAQTLRLSSYSKGVVVLGDQFYSGTDDIYPQNYSDYGDTTMAKLRFQRDVLAHETLHLALDIDDLDLAKGLGIKDATLGNASQLIGRFLSNDCQNTNVKPRK